MALYSYGLVDLQVLSMFSVFREYSESCRLILHSEPLREAMAGEDNDMHTFSGKKLSQYVTRIV